MKHSTWLAAAALALATPAQGVVHAFHCAFDLTLQVGTLRDSRPQNVMFILEEETRKICIVDDLPAGNAGGALNVALLYDALDATAAQTPYCSPGQRFGSFPSVAQAGPVASSRIVAGYRFRADGSGIGFDVSLPSLTMQVIDLPDRPSGYSGTGRCRTKPLPGFVF